MQPRMMATRSSIARAASLRKAEEWTEMGNGGMASPFARPTRARPLLVFQKGSAWRSVHCSGAAALRHGAADLALGVRLLGRLALVMQLLAATDRQLDLG